MDGDGLGRDGKHARWPGIRTDRLKPHGLPADPPTAPIPKVGPIRKPPTPEHAGPRPLRPPATEPTEPTQPIRPVSPFPQVNRKHDEDPVEQTHVVVAAEDPAEQTHVIEPIDDSAGSAKPSLLRASRSMAVATLFSRITGFLWKLVLAWVIGLGTPNDSFTAANNLPNIVFELLIGGVLTSVIVPVLVRAEKRDADGGEAYMQRLVTLASVVLAVGTVLAVVAAPLLTRLYVSSADDANPALATAFAYLLLPQIFFYGVSALLGAILQSKQVFGPPAWAPVVNNLVILGTLVAYKLLPGELTLNAARMTDAHLLVLGIGVTCGVVAQALIQVPALRRAGFRVRWRWGWDPRLSEFGGLAAWMITYVLVSQIGLMALSQVGTRTGGWAIYNNAWLLLQLPYGVIGFSLMTAILPRMSAAAADGDHRRVVDDLSLGNRMSTVALLPISAIMTALGTELGVALFSIGKSGADDATRLGMALAVSAFGLLPYAITMMQMRVFYALKDARTPTVIMIIMTALKVPLAYLCPILLSHKNVVLGLSAVNSLTFVVGWLVGEIWLRHRLGPIGGKRFLLTLFKAAVASVTGGGLAWAVARGASMALHGRGGPLLVWPELVAGSAVGFVAIFGVLWLLRVAELQPVIARLTGLLRRR